MTTIEPTPPERLPNPHPGEVLLEDFLKPMGLSQNQLARDIGGSTAARQRDRARQARCDRRHRPAPGALLRRVGGHLARVAGGARSREAPAGAGRSPRTGGTAPRGLTELVAPRADGSAAEDPLEDAEVVPAEDLGQVVVRVA